jgi:hypothetical protein
MVVAVLQLVPIFLLDAGNVLNLLFWAMDYFQQHLSTVLNPLAVQQQQLFNALVQALPAGKMHLLRMLTKLLIVCRPLIQN